MKVGYLLLVVVLGLLFGYGTMTVGKRKGYSPAPFFALGFILGFVGLIIALVLKDKKTA